LPTGSVTFLAGETQKTVTIAVQSDQVVEEDETFTVTLTGASDHGTIVTSTAVGTIINDDSRYDVVPTATSLAEGDSGSTVYELTIYRTGATADAATLDWSVSGGTADATDFTGGALPSGQGDFCRRTVRGDDPNSRRRR